jgi:serine/threonine protein kinase
VPRAHGVRATQGIAAFALTGGSKEDRGTDSQQSFKAVPALSAGSRLGAYEVQGLIRRGGMGVVYRARHAHLNRDVALKILPPEYADHEAFRERFIRESQSAAALNHPHIVTVYDAGEVGGLLYIAMQLIDGPDLATILHREGPLPAARCMWIVDQVAQALEAAHAHGLIHRDVKPANVLIDDECCYLTDFGLTKPVAVKTAVTSPGQFVGTVDYVAPEQIRGQQLDARADVYGLGCLMYRALAGQPPFPRDTEMAVIHAHLYDAPPTLSDVRQDLPRALDQVVRTALAKEREERYGSCTGLVLAANHALSGELRLGEESPTAVIRGERTTGVADDSKSDTARMSIAHRRLPLPSLRIGAVLLAVGALGLAALITLSRSGDHNNRRPTVPSTAAVRAETQSSITALDPDPPKYVGSLPTGLSVGTGGVWVANEGDGNIRRLDAVNGHVYPEKVSIGEGPDAIAAGADGVWVASRNSGMLTRVNPLTLAIVARIPVGRGPRAVSIGTRDSSVWVANERDGTVTRVDPNSNSPVPAKPIRVGRQPHALATTPGYVWVANRGSGTLSRIDTKTRRVAGPALKIGTRPTALTVANRMLWVANGDGTIVRVDIPRNTVLGRTRVGGAPSALAGNQTWVFVADRKRNVVQRLNATTGRIAGAPIKVGKTPMALRVGAGAAWVANRTSGTISRIEF